MVETKHIPPALVDKHWPQIRDGLGAALSGCVDITIEQVRTYLLVGSMQLAIGYEGDVMVAAAVVECVQMPQFKLLRVVSMYNVGTDSYKEHLETLEKWAADVGCSKVECWVMDEARQRVFSRVGFKPVYAILRKDIA